MNVLMDITAILGLFVVFAGLAILILLLYTTIFGNIKSFLGFNHTRIWLSTRISALVMLICLASFITQFLVELDKVPFEMEIFRKGMMGERNDNLNNTITN